MQVTDDSRSAAVIRVSLSNVDEPPSANTGGVVAYEHLLQRVWGANSNGDARPILTVVSTRRRRRSDNADNPTYIPQPPLATKAVMDRLRGLEPREASSTVVVFSRLRIHCPRVP